MWCEHASLPPPLPLQGTRISTEMPGSTDMSLVCSVNKVLAFVYYAALYYTFLFALEFMLTEKRKYNDQHNVNPLVILVSIFLKVFKYTLRQLER